MTAVSSDGAYKEASGAAGEIEGLKGEAAYEFANTGSQVLNISCEWVKASASSRQPSFNAVKEDSVLDRVRKRLKFFVMYAVAGSSAGTAEVLLGKPALQRLFAKGSAAVEAGQVLQFANLKVFDTSARMLGSDEKASHKKWVGALFASAGSSSMTLPSCATNIERPTPAR